MSTALAIAGVTAVLRDLLNDGLINHNISGLLGSSVTVSVQAPDRVVTGSTPEASQLNLFMYMVTPNLGWRNEGLPGRDGSGRTRLTNPPLALDLHYLLSAYSGADLHAEILLGYAMQLLHETPVLTREAIRTSLIPSPSVGNALPPALRALADSGLAEQVELIKINPATQSSEEMSKFWTATQSHLRPSAAYTASVVLIQAQRPARSALPVLTRGPRDAQGRETGIAVQPSLAASMPLLTRAEPPAGQPVSRHRRPGRAAWPSARSAPTAACAEQRAGGRWRWNSPSSPAAARSSGRDHGRRLARRPGGRPARGYLPSHAAGHPTRPAEPTQAHEQQPAGAGAGAAHHQPAADRGARRRRPRPPSPCNFTPSCAAGQHATLVLGGSEVLPLTAGATPTSLQFRVANAVPGTYLARLRVDGIESPIVDMDLPPGDATGHFLPITVSIT